MIVKTIRAGGNQKGYMQTLVNQSTGSAGLFVRPVLILASVAWSAWIGAVLEFCLSPDSGVVMILTWIALLLSSILILYSQRHALYLLPLPLLVGPISPLPIAGTGSATMGDIYAVLLVLAVLVTKISHLKISRRAGILLGFGVLLILLSALFSSDISSSLVGTLKILEFSSLVAISMLLMRAHSDWHAVFTAWVAITSIGALMMLWFLSQGQPYFLINWAGGMGMEKTIDVMQSETLLRPSFFYANFFIPLGLSLIYSLFSLLGKAKQPKWRALLLYATIPINAVALVLNNTRSMLLPIGAIVILTCICIMIRSLYKLRASAMVGSLLFMMLVGGLIYFSTYVIPDTQLDALTTRTTDSSPIFARLSIWQNALDKMADYPLRFFFVGWGPQSTARQGESALHEFLIGREGNTERAFDSTIIGFLIEYGLLLTLAIFVYVVIWLFKMWSSYRRSREGIALTVAIMGSALFATHIFQQFGFSPPALMALQVFTFRPSKMKFENTAHISRPGVSTLSS